MIIYNAKLIKITENINKTGRFLEDNLYYFGRYCLLFNVLITKYIMFIVTLKPLLFSLMYIEVSYIIAFFAEIK